MIYMFIQKLRNGYKTVIFIFRFGKQEPMEIDIEKLKMEVERLKIAESTIREERQELEAILRNKIHYNALRTRNMLKNG